MRFNKILGLACVAAAAILLGLVAFDVPYFKSIYFLRIELARGPFDLNTPYVTLGVLGYCTDLQDGLGLQCSAPRIGYSLSGVYTV